MKAMILAAGLGTRLRPLTNHRPKALVELNGRTLLEITLTRLQSFGVTEAIINVHHHAQMVIDYLKSKNNFNMRLEISREDDQLLDTGGGLKKAAWFFQENPAQSDAPFLLHNVDILTNIDLHTMLQFHKERHALATLAVQARESSRQLLFTPQLQLVGRRIHNQDTLIAASDAVILSVAKNPGFASAPPPTDETVKVSALGPQASAPHDSASSQTNKCHSERSEESAFSSRPPLLPLAFSGIHILSPRLLPQLTESTPAFSIIDAYLRLAAQGAKIQAFRHDTSYWRDLGKPADLTQAALDLQSNILPS
jgi:NDP-sugar pyrophosphorylase family protein